MTNKINNRYAKLADGSWLNGKTSAVWKMRLPTRLDALRSGEKKNEKYSRGLLTNAYPLDIIRLVSSR